MQLFSEHNQQFPVTKNLIICILFSCTLHHNSQSQDQFGFVMPPNQNRVIIPFENYNNLVIIPVIINNLLKVKFVLDTGVETPILTEEGFAGLLGIQYIRKISISGLGIEDSVNAFVGNRVKFTLPGGVIGHNLNLLVLEEDYLKLSEKLGEEVYGIIGYDLFKQFVVEINYNEKLVILHRPEKFRVKKRMIRKSLDIIRSKPYISAFITQEKEKDTVRLMIDSGASHAMLLDVNQTTISTPSKVIDARLGTGLAGPIPGTLGRIDHLSLDHLEFKHVIASFPKLDAYSQVIKRGSRQGTIGGEILSRVQPIFDYPNQAIYLRKSKKFNSPFETDMSGISLITQGAFLDTLAVEYIRPNSPSHFAGVKVHDIVLSVNGHSVRGSSLANTQAILKKRQNYKIKLRLLRDGEKLKKVFRLKRAI